MIQAPVFYGQILDKKTGTAQFNVSTLDIESIYFARPSLREQRAIVCFLDRATSDFETCIEGSQREIDLMREYRTRLIADVVTGKLDVSKAAAKLPEEAAQLEAPDSIEDDEANEDDEAAELAIDDIDVDA